MIAYEYRVVGVDGDYDWECEERFGTYQDALDWIDAHAPMMRHSGQSDREWIQQREITEWADVNRDTAAALSVRVPDLAGVLQQHGGDL